MKYISSLILIAGVIILISFFIQSYKTKNIVNSEKVNKGIGWLNNKSEYSGSEIYFKLQNAKRISFLFNTNSKSDQEIEIIINDKSYFIKSSEFNKSTNPINIDKNSTSEVIIRHHCIYLYDPCDINIDGIFVNGNAKIISFKRNKKILSIFGDSISTIYGRDNYTQILANKLGYELHNASVMGSTITKTQGVDFALSRYKKDLINYNSDILFIFLGTNDAKNSANITEFNKNYSSLVREIIKSNPKIKILLVGLPFRKDVNREELDKYNKIINSIAQRNNAFYVNTSDWLTKKDLSDDVHPSISSQQKIADRFYSVILSN